MKPTHQLRMLANVLCRKFPEEISGNGH